jgi:MYXO-CTERM domain-containing protein
MRSHNTRTALGLGCLFAAVAAAPASAGIMDVVSDAGQSTDQLGKFHGTIGYDATAEGGLLTVQLVNSSLLDNGGYITGFVFNIASSDPDVRATLISASHEFDGIAGQSAPPFGGPYTAGASLGGNWSGGGNPAKGIGVGETGMFVFSITGADTASLDAPDFFMGGAGEYNFVVRFRGFADGGSDKVPGGVPAPGAAALLGLAAVAARRRRR